MKKIMLAMAGVAIATGFAACGGSGTTPTPIITYPYETVYGDVCATFEPTPGCTFFNINGDRITVTEDTDYGKYGNGSDDMWYVKFDSVGNALVFNQFGVPQYSATAADFAGYISGTTIGVGTTGFFWENVAGGTYWLGKNGVLYSANVGEARYGQAINDKTSSSATDTNFAALNSDSNKRLVNAASDRLVKEYGFKKDKAVAIASALNSWAVAAAARGTTSEKDMDKTFRAVFGVQFSDALAAAKDLTAGNPAAMQDLTNRSASELGLKPHQAQKFMKGMYKKALANWGYDENSFNW